MRKIKGIEIKKGVAFGKPVIAGTRISVEFILDLLASGWKINKILKHYPHLRKSDIQAALTYSRDLIKEWKGYPLTNR
ncbi:DUF433 domain-containing protein [Candidatus Gottesmanbacteria bacterium]|nr:DUF433 domain-containing protein [Candidatus Gottesmanbacteria bacterium]